VGWEVSGTDEFEEWFVYLDRRVRACIIAVVEMLVEEGPQLGRPHADRISGSRFHNMKELRPRGPGKNCRILFIFDPEREAILLLGGDKTDKWEVWYKEAIPEAEKLYESYLADKQLEERRD